MVLANPEIGGLPAWVIGLVAAGGLAAALSTAAGLLLAGVPRAQESAVPSFFIAMVETVLVAGKVTITDA